MSNIVIWVLFPMVLATLEQYLKGLGLKLHPLVVEWLGHFFFGGGAPKRLPQEAVGQTKMAVIEALVAKMYEPSLDFINVASVGLVDGLGWFTTLAGVVGSFNFQVEPTSLGFHVYCHDTWDFNSSEGSSVLTLPVKYHSPLGKVIKLASSSLGFYVYEEDGFIEVDELTLVSLNEGRAFSTEWEFFISDREMKGLYPNGTGKEDYDWERGGLPKSFIK